MDIKFQDRIDEFLLHRDRMSAKEQADFLKEIEGDAEKKSQFELSRNVKDAFASRGNKLKAIAEFEKNLRRNESMKATGTNCAMPMHDQTCKETIKKQQRNKSIWIWMSGIAAVVIIGVFIIRPTIINNSNNSIMPGLENQYQKKKQSHEFEQLKSRKDSIKKDSVVIRKKKSH